MSEYIDALETGGDAAVRAMEEDRQQKIEWLLNTTPWDQRMAFVFLFAAIARPQAFTDFRGGRSPAARRYLTYWKGQLFRYTELLSANRFFFEPIFESLSAGKPLDPHADADLHDLMCGVCSIMGKQEAFDNEVMNTYHLIKQFTPA
ncbi:TPA: hypothetical protein L6L13_004251 [Escherichia coli]|nr:hypothetical protein [Escherichia coli]